VIFYRSAIAAKFLDQAPGIFHINAKAAAAVVAGNQGTKIDCCRMRTPPTTDENGTGGRAKRNQARAGKGLNASPGAYLTDARAQAFDSALWRLIQAMADRACSPRNNP
jgi:hypothetical protein